MLRSIIVSLLFVTTSYAFYTHDGSGNVVEYLQHQYEIPNVNISIVPDTAGGVVIDLPIASDRLQQAFQLFRLSTTKGLHEFVRTKHFAPSSVFYPFGGPDITYPLTLFPMATNFVLIGLEPCGIPKHIRSQMLERTCAQVECLLTRSFFISRNMLDDFSQEAGVLPTILIQLRLLGVDVVELTQLNDIKPGVKISFIYNNAQKNLYYYRANVHDDALPGMFLESLKSRGFIDAVMMKATSYSLHQDNFSSIRNLIIKEASLIFQDDSGIPIRFLQSSFDIDVFGNYISPYGIEFHGYLQPDLVLRQSIAQPIPFCFGYGCRSPQSPTVIIARSRL